MKTIIFLILSILILTLSGCANTPVAVPYPEPPVTLMSTAPILKTMPTPVTLSVILKTDIDNITTCKATAEQLTGLQEWVKQQSSVTTR